MINKSDLPGAEKAANHLADLWSAGYNARLGWKPRILKTCSIGKEAEGILKLKKAINEHYQFLTLAGKIRDRLPKALEAELLATIKCILFDRYLKSLDADTFEGILADVVAGKIGVHNAAMELVSQFTKSSPKGVCNNRQK